MPVMPDLYTKQQSKQLRAMMGEFEQRATRTMASIGGYFSAKDALRLRRELEKNQRDALEAAQRLETITAKMREKGLSEEIRTRLSLEGRLAKGRIANANQQSDIIEKTTIRTTARIGKAQQALLGQGLGKVLKGQEYRQKAGMGESFAGGLSTVFEAIKGKDIGGIGKLLKGMGKGAVEKGAGMATTAKGGVMGDLVSGLGSFLTKIGPAMIAIGSLAAGFAILAKIALDADSKVKELNKEILGTGIAAGDLSFHLGGVDGALSAIGNAFGGMKGLAHMQTWGNTAKENLQILNALGAAGYTYAEMTRGITGSTPEEKRENIEEKTRDDAAIVLTYSKVLGESADKIAGDMGKMMEETSMGLEGVRDRFSEIAAAASESGFGTKRFYAMVTQATTGMSMYNVRLNETLGMLTTLGKMVGLDAAGRMVGQKDFQSMSTKDRTLVGMKTDEQVQMDVIRRGSTDRAGSFLESIRGTGAEKAMGGLANLTPEELAKAMSKMNQDQLGLLSAQLGDTFGAKLIELWGSSQGRKGDLGNRQLAIGNMSGREQMVMQMFGGSKLPGLKGGVGKLQMSDITSNIAFDEMSGVSQENKKIMQTVQIQLQGLMKLADVYRGKMEAPGADKAAIAAEFNERTKMFGTTMGVGGEVTTRSGKELKKDTFVNMLMDVLDIQEKGKAEKAALIKTDRELAEETAKATTSMLERMDSVFEVLLREINNGIRALVDWFPGGGAQGTDHTGKAAALDYLEGAIATTHGAQAAVETPEEKAKIKERIAIQKTLATYVKGDKGGGSPADVMRRAASSAIASGTLSPEVMAAIAPTTAQVTPEDQQKVKTMKKGWTGVGLHKEWVDVARSPEEIKAAKHEAYKAEYAKVQADNLRKLIDPKTQQDQADKNAKALVKEMYSADEARVTEELTKRGVPADQIPGEVKRIMFEKSFGTLNNFMTPTSRPTIQPGKKPGKGGAGKGEEKPKARAVARQTDSSGRVDVHLEVVMED